ncbi:hypothetical protein C0991_004517 [Blastosporella zonata]|nr:hypothetical protein C0991_004517 [Blastosporella zonata]
MPAIRARKPLRERCNVQLNVKTSIPNEIYDDYLFTPDTPTPICTPPPRVGRGRTTQRKPLADTTNLKKTANMNRNIKKPAPKPKVLNDTGVPRLLPMPTPTAGMEMPALHRLVPYSYVGFHRGPYLPRSIISANGSLFTHIVKITYASGVEGDLQAGDVNLQVDLARGLILLALIVPAPDDDKQDVNHCDYEEEEISKRTITVLTESQLLVARDFLALALPYYAEAHPNSDVSAAKRSADSVRVLLTAPEGNNTEADIMSVAACYLAWASEEPVATVLEYIGYEEEVPTVWKEAVRGEDAVRLVAKVATLG